MIKKKGLGKQKQDQGYADSVASSMGGGAGLDTISMLSKAMNQKISVSEIRYLSVISTFFIILYVICMVFFEVVLGGMRTNSQDVWDLDRKWSLIEFNQTLFFYYTIENLYY
jgi:hypothetical protein